ncbi:porin family protein [Salegentibacter sp. HM20]
MKLGIAFNELHMILHFRILFSSLIVFLFLSFTPLLAQEAQSYGVKSGVNLAYLSNNGSMNLRPGFQVGAYAKYSGLETIFFKAEFLITQKGSASWSSDQPNNFNLFYVDLPIMFGLSLSPKLSLNAGIQPSMLIGGRYKGVDSMGREYKKSIGKDLARFDYSTLLGLEYFIHDNWLLGVRYNYGFVSIQEYSEEFIQANNGKLLKNRGFQFYVGYKFN